MTITKIELSKMIAVDNNMTQKAAKEAIDAVFSAIVQNLQEGTNVKINGFGTFGVRRVGVKNGVNPKTHEHIIIPAHNKLTMNYSTTIKEFIKQNDDITKSLEAGE